MHEIVKYFILTENQSHCFNRRFVIHSHRRSIRTGVGSDACTRSSGTLPDTVHRVFPPTQRFVRSAFGATRGSHVRGGVCAAIGVIVFPSRLSERGCGEWFTHVWLCEVSEWRLVLGVKVCDGATTSPSRGGVTPETCVLGSGVSRLASFSCQCGQIGSGPSGFACIVCECIVWVCLAVCVLSEAAAVISTDLRAFGREAAACCMV